MPTERNYIGAGGFGRVFVGKLREKVVALKVLYKSDNDVVSHLRRSYEGIIYCFLTGVLPRSVDVGISQAQVCAAVLRNLRSFGWKSAPTFPCLTLHDEWYAGPMAEKRKSISIRYRRTRKAPCSGSLLMLTSLRRYWKQHKASNIFIQ